MKIKKIFFIILVITLIIININYYVIPYFSTQEKNLEFTTSEVVLNSDDLVNSYVIYPNNSDSLYTGKVIEISGFVKEVTFLNNRNTVLLYSKNKTSGVICDVHPSQIEKVKNLKENQKITVKGICKGFLKDVVLLNCYIDLKPNE